MQTSSSLLGGSGPAARVQPALAHAGLSALSALLLMISLGASWWTLSAAIPGFLSITTTAYIFKDTQCVDDAFSGTGECASENLGSGNNVKQFNNGQGVALPFLLAALISCIFNALRVGQFVVAARSGGDVDIRGQNFFGSATRRIIIRGLLQFAFIMIAYGVLIGQATDWKKSFDSANAAEGLSYDEIFTTVGPGAACAISAAVFSAVGAATLYFAASRS